MSTFPPSSQANKKSTGLTCIVVDVDVGQRIFLLFLRFERFGHIRQVSLLAKLTPAHITVIFVNSTDS